MDFSKYTDEMLVEKKYASVTGAYVYKVKECYSDVTEYDDGKRTEDIVIKATPVKRITASFNPVSKPDGGDVVKIDKKLYKVTPKVDEIVYASEEDEKVHEFNVRVMYADKDQYGAKQFASAIKLVTDNPKFTTKQLEVAMYDFDEKGFVKKKMPSYTELIGKEIGIMMKFSKTYRRKKINGYTGEKLFRDDDTPYQVWVKDYDKPLNLNFNIDHFFDPKDLRTFTEKKEQSKATQVYRFIKKVDDYTEQIPPESEQDKYRKKRLMLVLDKLQEKFDSNLWQSSAVTSSPAEGSDEFDFGANVEDDIIDI